MFQGIFIDDIESDKKFAQLMSSSGRHGLQMRFGAQCCVSNGMEYNELGNKRIEGLFVYFLIRCTQI